jgi:hypothetical protein
MCQTQSGSQARAVKAQVLREPIPAHANREIAFTIGHGERVCG